MKKVYVVDGYNDDSIAIFCICATEEKAQKVLNMDDETLDFTGWSALIYREHEVLE